MLSEVSVQLLHQRGEHAFEFGCARGQFVRYASDEPGSFFKLQRAQYLLHPAPQGARLQHPFADPL
jgi:hypothetical protein